jgi:hypothetical protein
VDGCVGMPHEKIWYFRSIFLRSMVKM